MSTSNQQSRQNRNGMNARRGPRTFLNTVLHVKPNGKNQRNGQGGRGGLARNGNYRQEDQVNGQTDGYPSAQRQDREQFSHPRKNGIEQFWRVHGQGSNGQLSRTQRQWNDSNGRPKNQGNDRRTNERPGKNNQPITWGGKTRKLEVKKDLKVPLELTRKQKLKPRKFVCPDLVEIDHVKTEDEWKVLDSLIQTTYESHRLTPEREAKAKLLVDELRRKIQKEIPGARLEPFGSIANGCGSAVCDIDICFRYEEDEPPADKVPIDVIRELGKILKHAFKNNRSNRFRPIECRISILKMTVDGFDADISYYNEMALKNTVLLKRYCEWSPERFPQLILWVKKWAKDCDVNSSASGTLSSYALTLMLIHFLQQCSPPVLPHWNMTDEELVEGYDFSSNEVDPNWSENRQSVGQLFVGFLDFYSRYNFTKLISILRKELLDKKSKTFNPDKVRSICIEDPYIDDFNPGYTVKDTKFKKVLAVFRCSREVFAGKLEEVIWNPETQQRCMRFHEELDEYEMAQINGRIVFEDKQDDKLEKKKHEQLLKIFKGMLECRGEGTLTLLKNAYKRANKSVLKEDLSFFCGKETLEAFLSHPFLEKHVNITDDLYFKIKQETMEIFTSFVESHPGFSSPDKNLATGARRFIKVLQYHDSRGVKQDQFEKLYFEVHGVQFDQEERERYFGSPDIDKVVKMVEKYGVSSKITKAGLFLFRLKNLIGRGKNDQELKKLIRQFGSSGEEGTDAPSSPETSKKDQRLLPEGVRRFKHVLSQSMKPMGSLNLKKTYKLVYDRNLDQEERIRQFGVSPMGQIADKIQAHGVKVERISKDNYTFTLIEEDKEKEKPKKSDRPPIPSGTHPFFRS